MRQNRCDAKDPVALVAKSRRGMVDAVRQALAGAARTLGTLESCDASMLPQIVRNGRGEHFEVVLSVIRRGTRESAN
jgi:flavin-binding protein dodecin